MDGQATRLWRTAPSFVPFKSVSTVNAHTNWPLELSVTFAPAPLEVTLVSPLAALPNDTVPSGFTVILPNVPLSEVSDGSLYALNGLASASAQVATHRPWSESLVLVVSAGICSS